MYVTLIRKKNKKKQKKTKNNTDVPVPSLVKGGGRVKLTKPLLFKAQSPPT